MQLYWRMTSSFLSILQFPAHLDIDHEMTLTVIPIPFYRVTVIKLMSTR